MTSNGCIMFHSTLSANDQITTQLLNTITNRHFGHISPTEVSDITSYSYCRLLGFLQNLLLKSPQVNKIEHI